MNNGIEKYTSVSEANNDSLNENFLTETMKTHSSSQYFRKKINTKNKSQSSNKSQIDSLLWSDEDDSPMCIEPSNRPSFVQQISGGNTESSDLLDILEERNLETCPLCSKRNNNKSISSFASHLKNCAFLKCISTQKLIEVVKLHQKQANERDAIGLQSISSIKPNARRITTNKGTDAALQLGIALSTSHIESEMKDKIQEAEVLLEAGLEKEALSQYRNLNHYGFVDKKCNLQKSRVKGFKKNYQNCILLSRKDEERQRIINERVAEILLDLDERSNSSHSWFTSNRCFKSKYLIDHADENTTLWRRSYQLEEHNEYDIYYINNLSSFITPCQVVPGSKLRNISQIPLRSSSSENSSKFNQYLDELIDFFDKKENTGDTSRTVSCNTHTIVPKKIPPIKKVINISSPSNRLCHDWKLLLNNVMLSDVTIYAKGEIEIFAHKLVLYVRCRTILVDTIKEESTSSSNTSEILMWMDYSREAVLAFLQFLYCGYLPDIECLTDVVKKELINLARRYNVHEVEQFLPEKSDIFPVDDEMVDEIPVSICKDEESISDGAKNLKLLSEALQNNSVGGYRSISNSPELFCNDDEVDIIEDVQRTINHSPDTKDFMLNLSSPNFEERINNKESKFDTLLKTKNDIDEFVENNVSSYKRKSTSPVHVENNFKKVKLSDLERTSDSFSCEKRNKFKVISPDKMITTNDDEDDNPINKQKEDDKSPYVSPVWDGFEEMNYDDFHTNEWNLSPDVCSSAPTVDVNYTTPKLSNSKTEKFNYTWTKSDLIEFDSFSFAENDLGDIENRAGYSKTQIPIANSPVKPVSFTQIPTSSANEYRTPKRTSIRKFQCRSKSENVLTPCRVTPCADYSAMKTVEIKKELNKYGLKECLSRNKAKKLLRFIYDELHPTVESDKRSDNGQEETEENMSNVDDNSDSENSDSIYNEIEDMEASNSDEDVCYSQNKSKKVVLDEAFRSLLASDTELHKQILLYEPVSLELLKENLKELGAKCSQTALIEYLDEKCITFKMENHRKRRSRKRK